jgi:hypothetical protein
MVIYFGSREKVCGFLRGFAEIAKGLGIGPE